MTGFRHLLACAAILGCLVPADRALAEDIRTQRTEPSPCVPGSWTIVVLPDTQNYVAGKQKSDPRILDKMMDWIAEERLRREIRLVVHVGDVTNSNSAEQWGRIRSSYRKLDNLVPYLLCEGNHDVKDGESRINDFFKAGDNRCNTEIFGGSYEPGKLQNIYYVMNHNDLKYLFLALEWSTRTAVMEWADAAIKSHPDHRVFITVHKYMSEASRLTSADGQPDPNKKCGSGYDTVGVFNRLAKPNANVEFITCGHVGPVKEGTTGQGPRGYEGVLVFDNDIATGHRSDRKAEGVAVHQVLFNAQFIPNGGDGWMLLLEFSPDNKTVKVKTFSPHLNLWRTGPEYEYALERISSGQS